MNFYFYFPKDIQAIDVSRRINEFSLDLCTTIENVAARLGQATNAVLTQGQLSAQSDSIFSLQEQVKSTVCHFEWNCQRAQLNARRSHSQFIQNVTFKCKYLK